MLLSNEHFAVVEILSFQSYCRLEDMSYEQMVNVRIDGGSIIRLFDFLGFAVNESRLGEGKKVVLCVCYIDGKITVLERGEPGLLESDFDPQNEAPSKLTLAARILGIDEKDHELLVDAGFGKIYVLPDEDVSGFNTGDIIRFKADRLDLIEIME